MSGIVGLLNFDGAPIDPTLLTALTNAMAFRGPDRFAVCIDGPAGFGERLLQTTPEACPLPASNQGRWIAADARLDERGDLMRALISARHTGLEAACDARLILCAYETWGDACLHRLRGDFAFAIWDGPARRLFCARDQLGVKPFYYARTGASSLIFSNTLDCVRSHPAVSSALDEHAMGDFLLFGYNRHLDRTTFAAVQRLPPAHALAWSADGPRQWRYWRLPQPHVMVTRHQQDVVEEFRETFRAAVADRVGSGATAVLMSGGLDSTSVAAMAHACRGGSQALTLRAHSVAYDGLLRDDERRFAALAARAFDIPIAFVEAADYGFLEGADATPEPSDNPLPRMAAALLESAASHARIALTGEGGDAVLAGPSGDYFVDLLRRGRFATFGRAMITALVHGRVPPLGIRSGLRRLAGTAPGSAHYPPWIAARFEARTDLRSRWHAVVDEDVRETGASHRAWRELQAPFWPYLLETYDPGVTGVPLQCRHPFLDLRVIACLLQTPGVPWLMDKHILRRAMRGLSPRAIRLRPKTPLGGDPTAALLRRPGAARLTDVRLHPELLEYVDLAKAADRGDTLRPLCLSRWLARVASAGGARKESNHERRGAAKAG
jgi:asparagine synthase (glutamine-hydrolysing)